MAHDSLDAVRTTTDAVQLRLATADDVEQVFAWRNDPFIVARGTRQSLVTRAEHEAWFTRFLADTSCRMYLIQINGEPAGQVRFYGLGAAGEAEVSIYLMERFTGGGFGVTALRKACHELFATSLVSSVVAFVRTENAASCRAFKKAGFDLVEPIGRSLPDHCAFGITRPQGSQNS